jgi:hypothetical protein
LDKLAETLKVTVAVFHGIIATWLFLEFSDTKVDEFYFVILLIFFTTANLLLWRGLNSLLTLLKIRRPSTTQNKDVFHIKYNAIDVALLSVISIFVGLLSAYLYRKDVILTLANKVADWETTSTATPYENLISNTTAHTMQFIDRRPPDQVSAAGGGAYFRVYMKDNKFGYEGYPGSTSGKLDVREVILSPACYFSFDGDSKKMSALRTIDGPGVYLSLGEVGVIEIIDANKSECARLFKY